MAIATVITADIVNSTTLPKAEIKKLIKTIESLAIVADKVEFYRGDSFQLFLKNNTQAFRLLLTIRLAAKRMGNKPGADIRAGIGIGNITAPVRELRISSEEPFVLSGRLLDEISRQDEQTAIKSSDAGANCAFTTIGRFIDYIFRNLTAKQAEAIFELLMGKTQTEAAKKLKKSQVTINKQAHAGGWTEIEKLLDDYENTLYQFLIK